MEEYLVPYLSIKGWKIAHYVFENDEWVLKGTFSKIFESEEAAKKAISEYSITV